jgi:hypothetical protein
MPRSPSPPPGRQDGDVREAAGPQSPPNRKRMVEAVETRACQHGLVQLPPRARGHAGQAADRRRPLGRIFHYRTQFSCRTGRSRADLPQGGEGLWRLDASVAGSGVTGDLLAHNIDTALWLNGPIDEVTAMTETFIKERKHNLTGKVEPVTIDDASAVPRALRERLAGDVRGDALRARPQGALHARDQRRERLDQVGSARSAPAAVLRPSRRRQIARLEEHPHHRRRPSLHEALVGARPADRLRAHVHPPGGRFPCSTDYVTDAVLKSAKDPAMGESENV